MAEAEAKKQTRRTRKRNQEAVPETASSVSGEAKPQTRTNKSVTKLDSGLVVVTR